jgi:hypothetical protein
MTVGYMTIGAADVEAALPFFDAVLTPVGYARGPFDGGWAFYGKPGQPGIGICKPHDGQPARGGNGMMVGLKVDSHDTVRSVYDAALANGGTDEGPPGFRPPDGTSFYGAYFRDAVGNKFCVFASPDF